MVFFDSINIMQVSKMKNRVGYMDALRGIAAVCVFFSHSSRFINDQLITWSGGLGVVLLFVISGFFACEQNVYNFPFNTWKDILTYYKKRFIKIYPCYFIAVLFTYIMGLMSQKELMETLILYNGYAHFWFVPYICGFYLLEPFICIVINKIGKKKSLVPLSLYVMICFGRYLIIPSEKGRSELLFFAVIFAGMIISIVIREGGIFFTNQIST